VFRVRVKGGLIWDLGREGYKGWELKRMGGVHAIFN